MLVAVSYRDETTFGDGRHNIDQIAEAIRHKKYGKDVREAIAQGFEVLLDQLDGLEGQDNSAEINAEIAKQVRSAEDRLVARINRIVIGTDNETTRIIVEQILKEKGVI